MKILYILGQLALHGGIERVTSLKINYLAEHGHEVYLLTYEQMERPFVYPVSDKVHCEDIGIDYNVSDGESLYAKRCLKLVPKHFKRTRQYLQHVKPDIIVVPNFGYEFWFIPFIKGNAKIVREVHCSMYNSRQSNRLKDKIHNVIDDFSFRNFDYVVVLTPEEKSYFKYNKNLCVIPNPGTESEYKSDLSSNTIISVGRIAPVKQFEKLVDIAKSLTECGEDFTIKIYGEGEPTYLTSLKQKVVENELQDKVLFVGRTDNVYKMMSEASIYICTSKTECFGMTLIEAQECGLPVVSFDCPNGPRNIVNDGVDGYLVIPDSIEEFAEKLHLLLKDTEKRIRFGRNAEKNAGRFHVVSVMKEWVRLFES